MNVTLEPGQSASGTVGVQAFDAGGTPELLAVQAVQSSVGGLVVPSVGAGVQSPFVPSVIGPYVAEGQLTYIPYTVSVPMGTAPGTYMAYLVLVNPMLSCPGGSTFCINIQTQAAYPTEVVVLGPDGATPGPFTEVPGGVSGFRDFDNGNGTYAAFPVQTETNSSANVFGYATVEDSITSESTGQTWTFGPQVIEPVLPGQTVGGYPGGYQGTAPFPSGTFEATACLWVGPALPWGSEEAPYTTGTPSCVTTEVTN